MADPAAAAGGYGDLGSESVQFPAFRSEQWIKAEFDKLRAPSCLLEGVKLQPEYMTSYPTVGLYPGKVAQVQEQMKGALFRQALFKIQNVEVTRMEECKDARVLQRIVQSQSTSLAGRLMDMRNPRDVKLMREEVWTVDRCGVGADYEVRYFKEGGDGFSASVMPLGLGDQWQALRFYLSGD
eukprot:TRINITY_DN109722_c0_g1_i1.p1 TRINITY_DN109722_c0_g1~~TRINITY_DN109722_c0_g1_i1.p1  ORF type:complete len:213 (-),score=51.63 TRINITY_DN109722_c0_g1_i1:364-909(-)